LPYKPHRSNQWLGATYYFYRGKLGPATIYFEFSGHNKKIEQYNAPDKPVIFALVRQAQLGASYVRCIPESRQKSIEFTAHLTSMTAGRHCPAVDPTTVHRRDIRFLFLPQVAQETKAVFRNNGNFKFSLNG
jgi:hypothetical protein